MILEKQKEATVLETGDSQESIGMSLDLDSAQILMQMLSKNLYSDPIGSTIRECASNALDSHRRANIDKPIVVSLGANETGGFEFSVEDFGTGLDADDVENIISKYGKSTKRNSTTELGMLGLGFKAPLAYSSSFYFIARKNGTERKYMMYEGEEVNTIDLLYTRETEEGNGVKIIVPINYYDRYEFNKKIREQLAYFENVYFNISDGSIKNDFVIFKSEDFKFSELASDHCLHICLDNVYYPLDFKKIGIDAIIFPLALNFSLTDGIFPTPNRESIRYTSETKKIILDKIAKVADYFVNKYNESIEDVDNIEAVMDFYGKSSRNYTSFNKTYDVNSIAKYATNSTMKSPKLNGVKLIDMATFYRKIDYLFQEYSCKFSFERGRMSNLKNNSIYSFHPRNIFNCEIYYCDGKVSGLVKDYLRELSKSNRKTIIIVKKEKSLKLGVTKNLTMGSYDCYRNILQLDSVSKTLWRDYIKEYQYILSLFTDKWSSIEEELVVPQWFIDSRKKVRSITSSVGTSKRRKITGEVVGKKAVELLRYASGKNCKWESTNFVIENMHKNSYLTIYSSHSEADALDNLYGVTRRSDVNFVTFSEKELNIVKKLELKNWMTYTEFMEGNNKTFKRLASVKLIDQLYRSNSSIFSSSSTVNELSTSIFNKINNLYNYRNKWNVGNSNSNLIFDIAETKNLYDTTIMDDYYFIKDLLEKNRFLNGLIGEMRMYSSKKDVMFPAICDLCKYHKIKLNAKNYKNNIVEETQE